MYFSVTCVAERSLVSFLPAKNNKPLFEKEPVDTMSAEVELSTSHRLYVSAADRRKEIDACADLLLLFSLFSSSPACS